MKLGGKCNRCGEFGHCSDQCTKSRPTRDNRENRGIGYANHDQYYDQEPQYDKELFDGNDDPDLADVEVTLEEGERPNYVIRKLLLAPKQLELSQCKQNF